MNNGTHYEKTEAMNELEERVNSLEQWKLDLENAIISRRTTLRDPSLARQALPVIEDTPLALPAASPHFNLRRPDRELLAVLHGLKHLQWTLRKVRQEGVFDGDVGEEEWLYALKGPGYGSPTARQIPWRAKYLCKSFVAQYLSADYSTAEQVFCLAGGKPITALINTNISKNKELCDEQTGKIAAIIRTAIKFAD